MYISCTQIFNIRDAWMPYAVVWWWLVMVMAMAMPMPMLRIESNVSHHPQTNAEFTVCVFFFFIYLCAKLNTRTIWAYTPSSHVCNAPFFPSSQNDGTKYFTHSACVYMLVWTNEMRFFQCLHLCTLWNCEYMDLNKHTYTHTITIAEVIYKIWLQVSFSSYSGAVCQWMNGCGWFDSHLLSSG